jgi:hypothetical protein
MKALFPTLVLIAAALLISPWASASRQLAKLPATISAPSGSLQALVGKGVVVRYLNYAAGAYDSDPQGTLLSADDSGLMIQVGPMRKFVPMHAIRSVTESN